MILVRITLRDHISGKCYYSFNNDEMDLGVTCRNLRYWEMDITGEGINAALEEHEGVG